MLVPAIASNSETWNHVLAGMHPQVRERIEQLIGEAPPLFDFMIAPLEEDAAADKPGQLSALLLGSGLVIRAITDPALLSAEEAARMARAAARLDDRLDDKILTSLTAGARTWPDDIPETEIVRALELIDAVSDCHRLVIPLVKFVNLPQPHLRSKAVKLIARASRNPGWAELILSDRDPRVRANLIDEMASQTGFYVDALLRQAAHDPHHRVAISALLALAIRGDASARDQIEKLSTGGSPMHRRAAEWALRRLEE